MDAAIIASLLWMPQGFKTVLPSQMKAFPVILKDALGHTIKGDWSGSGVSKPLCLKAVAVLPNVL